MSMKQVMRISLSMEELMTIILKVNQEEGKGQRLAFDLRLFAIQDVRGIRIRYSGMEYNPFGSRQRLQEEDYMGVRMIYGLAESVIYQRTFGMNVLRIMI